MGKKNKQHINQNPGVTIPGNENVIDGKVKKKKNSKKKQSNKSLHQDSKIKVEAVIKEFTKPKETNQLSSSVTITKKNKKKDQNQHKSKDIKLKQEDNVILQTTVKDETKQKKKKKKGQIQPSEIGNASTNEEPESKITYSKPSPKPREVSKVSSASKNIKKIKEKMQKQKKNKIKPEKEKTIKFKTTIKSESEIKVNGQSDVNKDEETKEEIKEKMEKKKKTQNPVGDVPNASIDEGKERKIRHDSKPENTIFVGNLANNTKKKQLEGLFKVFGKIVSIRFRTSDGKIMFKHSARLKSDSLIAYVVFDNAISKEKALSLSGTEFKGRRIRVTAATNFKSQFPSKAIVFIGNLKYSATDEKLYEVFSTCGSIEYVRTLRNEKGCSGIAYVCFKKPESVSLALELNNTLLDDRPIRVQRYKKYPEKVTTNPKELKGPARRLLEKKMSSKKGFKNADDKRKVFHKGKDNNPESKEFSKTKLKTPKLEKKSDYHGKKIANKMKLKEKKKQRPTHLQKLAKKIAPK